MHKKYHEKFKILDILAVTTQAREGIETLSDFLHWAIANVTTQAREGIETCNFSRMSSKSSVTTQVREGIETAACIPANIQCLSPAKKYKLYKSSINKSIHFVQRSLSSSTRG